ncbi:MAG: FtsQ-type POTRA domain-containing protein [Waterburya sp.]
MSAFPPPQLQYKLSLVKLQQHRSARISLWRACLLICCTMSLSLLATLPYWQVKHKTQIKISGEKLVSENTIYSTLNFAYPQFIWAVNGLNLAQKIESIPSVAVAKVNRRIIPPRIIISLQEKNPVAIATFQGKVGFLDFQGEWIALNFYGNVNADYPLPKIKVINYEMQFSKDWSKIYELISLYPELKISEVHWNQSSSVFLQTKIGQVFLGSELSRLEQQFKIMTKLKNLPNHLESSEIAYIDLSNPDINLIQRY